MGIGDDKKVENCLKFVLITFAPCVKQLLHYPTTANTIKTAQV